MKINRRQLLKTILLTPLAFFFFNKNISNASILGDSSFNEIYKPNYVAFNYSLNSFQKSFKIDSKKFKTILGYDDILGRDSIMKSIQTLNLLGDDYLRLIHNLVGKTQIEICEELHLWINQNIIYKSEKKQKDYWQKPNETLKLGSGDCEDFVLLYHYSLRLLGFNSKNLLFSKGQINHNMNLIGHMVLIVKIVDDFFVLDNAAKKVVSLETHKNTFLPKIGCVLEYNPSFYSYLKVFKNT